MYDYAVFIGRFQPPHVAHLAAIRRAFEIGRKVILVLGSHHAARTPKNPWTSGERREMVEACLTPDERARLEVVAVQDWLYNDNLWIASVQREVQAIVPEDAQVALVGFQKDESSYYLSLFPEWTCVDLPEVVGLHSTEIRHRYLTTPRSLDFEEALPEPVRHWLKAWEATPAYRDLVEEYRYILQYRAQWSIAPYPVNFVTADAVVVWSGHVLLVERKNHPGRGLYALPGGFVDTHETILKAALRELSEETQLQVEEADLLHALEGEKVFDHPARSLRGRTITHAFCFNLGSGPLPRVTPSDDAAKAFWLPLAEVQALSDRFFDDHKDIVTYFTHRF